MNHSYQLVIFKWTSSFTKIDSCGYCDHVILLTAHWKRRLLFLIYINHVVFRRDKIAHKSCGWLFFFLWCFHILSKAWKFPTPFIVIIYRDKNAAQSSKSDLFCLERHAGEWTMTVFSFFSELFLLMLYIFTLRKKV